MDIALNHAPVTPIVIANSVVATAKRKGPSWGALFAAS